VARQHRADAGAGAERIFPTHFGGSGEVAWHLDDLEGRLSEWAEWSGRRLAEGVTPEALTDELRGRAHAEVLAAGGTDALAEAYEAAVPTAMMAAGLVRYHQVHAAP
jgi:microcystin-dependent protein